MNKKVLAVITREYVTRVRTKGFIIGTLITPLMFVLIFGGIFIFSILFQPSTKEYHVIDQSGLIYDDFVPMLSDTLDSGEPEFRFTKVDLANQNLDTVIFSLQSLINGKEIDGYLLIPEDIVESRKVKYAARSVSNWDEQKEITRSISRIVTNHRLAKKGFPPDSIRKEFRRGRVELISRQVTEEGELEKSGASSFILTYILAYVLFLMVMIYGQTVMRSVIEEKSQRITETIVSSMKPIELLVGKLIGISFLGLTQLIVIGLFVLGASVYGGAIFTGFGVTTPDLLDVVNQINFSVSVFAFFIIFFLMGYIFYAGLYAVIGAIVNTEDEGQHLQFPIIILIMFGFFMMFSVAQNPETSMAYWISLIPLFSPIVMFARIAVCDPVIPDGAYLSIIIMIITIVLMLKVIAKIYRVGILMYGKKPSLKEALKWIRYS